MTKKHIIPRKSQVVGHKKAAPLAAEHHIDPATIVPPKPAEKTFMQRMFS